MAHTRKIIFAAAVSFGIAVYAAAQQPVLQWQYGIDPGTGNGTAYYPGDVRITGNLYSGFVTFDDLYITGGLTVDGPSIFNNSISTSVGISGGYISGSSLSTNGNLLVQGNATIGDAATDTHTFAGTVTFGNSITANGPINNITGRTNGTSPGSPYIGQRIFQLGSSGVSVTAGTPTNLTSVSIPPGNWLCAVGVNFSASASSVTAYSIALSTTSATFPTPYSTGLKSAGGITLTSGGLIRDIVPHVYLQFTSNTTVYNVFTTLGANASAQGHIECLRAP